MITTYLRSSSIGAHKICPMQFFLAYTLNLPAKAGKAAALGNCCHKALETLAWYSYHKERGNTSYEDETFGHLELSDITPEWATDASYHYYKGVEDHVKWDDRHDLPQCHEWVNMALNLSGGYFDPRNMSVVEPEKRFDLVIDKPWAAYEYDTPSGKMTGQLSVKGTMDLVIRDKQRPGEIEIIDWKTGRRKDWSIADEATSVKDFKALIKDPQLLLYYYATNRLYPEAEMIHFTIVYIRDGGPFRIPFGPEHMDEAEGMIRKNFEAMKGEQYPALKKGPPCWTWCSFGKRSKCDKDPSQTVCNYYAAQVKEKGADRVLYEFGDMDKLSRYQDGGGRKSNEAKELG